MGEEAAGKRRGRQVPSQGGSAQLPSSPCSVPFQGPLPSAHAASHFDPTLELPLLLLWLPPSECLLWAWLFGFSPADWGADASPRLCAHFAKQQKFTAQVIDHRAAASLHLALSPNSLLPALLFFLSAPSVVSEKRKPRRGRFWSQFCQVQVT